MLASRNILSGFKEAYLGADYLEYNAVGLRSNAQHQEYRVGVRGFRLDPDAWGERYAGHRAFEIPGLRVR